MAIVWLASFPKSGNTWLRAFLINFLSNSDHPVPLKQLESFAYSDAHAWPYSELSGKPHTDMGEAEILRLRPAVHRRFAESQPSHVLVKTHFGYGEIADVPTITKDVTAGAIYIARNPWDVAISYASHYGVAIDDAITAIAQPSLTIQASAHNVTQYVGSWSTHLGGWHGATGLRRLTIRYEDMVADPTQAFAQVVRFMGLPNDPARLERAIRHASFDELQAQEARDGFVERSRNADRFFRAGKAGAWRDVLSQAQVRRVMGDHANMLKAAGYVSKDGKIL